MSKEKLMETALIISLVINILLFVKVNSIENTVEYLDSSIVGLSNSINNVNSNVYAVQETINEQGNFVVSTETKVDPKDISENGYLLNVNVSFKELLADETPYLVYRSFKHNGKVSSTYSDWTEVKLEEIATLSYGINLALNYNNDYEYKFVTKGAQERSSSVNSIISNQFSPIIISANEWFTESGKKNGTTGVIVNVYNQYNIEGYDVDKIVMKVDGVDKEYVAEKLDDSYYGDKMSKPGVNSAAYKISIPLSELPKDNAGYRPVSIEVICKNGFKIIDDQQILSYNN